MEMSIEAERAEMVENKLTYISFALYVDKGNSLSNIYIAQDYVHIINKL